MRMQAAQIRTDILQGKSLFIHHEDLSVEFVTSLANCGLVPRKEKDHIIFRRVLFYQGTHESYILIDTI